MIKAYTRPDYKTIIFTRSSEYLTDGYKVNDDIDLSHYAEEKEIMREVELIGYAYRTEHQLHRKGSMRNRCVWFRDLDVIKMSDPINY